MERMPTVDPECDRIVSSVPHPQAALLPLLDLAQRKWGYVPAEWIARVAELTAVPRARVTSIVSSLPRLRTQAPGRHTVTLCGGLSCRLMGSRTVADFVVSHLGVSWGGTTPDGRITLLRADCLGACSTAPAMLVDDHLHTLLTLERVTRILAVLR